jgi:hypothetical protein
LDLELQQLLVSLNMQEPVLNPIANLANATSAVNTINANSVVTATALQNTLDRYGSSPNQMQSVLDMNSYNIVNLPAPATINSPARLIDVVSNPSLSVPATGTSGSTVPFLNGGTAGTPNTWSGYNLFTGTTTIDNGISGPALSGYTSSYVDVRYYGAVGDGVHDDTVAINNALATGQRVYLPKSTAFYKISGTLTITISGTTFFGDGPETSVIKSSISTGAMLTIAAGLNSVTVSNIGFTRNSLASVGGYGIQCLGRLDECRFSNLEIQLQNIGALFLSAGWGTINDLYVHNNGSHGLYFSNIGAVSSADVCQWIVRDILSQQNTGSGLVVISVSNSTSQLTMGNWYNINTYNNTGYGVYVDGTLCPIQGFRMRDFFIGSDLADGIYLKTYNTAQGYTELSDGFTEAAGGNGVNIITNNTFTVLDNVIASYNGAYGFLIADASKLQVTGCTAVGNTTAAFSYTANSGSQIGKGNNPATMDSPAIGAATATSLTSGSLNLTGAATSTNSIALQSGTATTAGGAATPFISWGSSGIGLFFGSGAPSGLTAAQGSIYFRQDGAAGTAIYLCTVANTTWVAVT